MKYSLVGIPQEQDLKLLNNLRDYVYQNNFRFKNKPLDSDTHITLTEVVLNKEEEIYTLRLSLLKNLSSLKQFTVSKSEWMLTKEEKEPNYKINLPYTWIALKFLQRKEIFEALNRLTEEIGVNNNAEYINDVKKIEGDIPDEECIANHINLSNYTQREMGGKCWEYFDMNLPEKIVFDRIALRDEKGLTLFIIYLHGKKFGFLDLAYWRFNCLYDLLMTSDVIPTDRRFMYLKEIFQVYAELCKDKRLKDVFEKLKETRPKEQEQIVNKYFSVIRHLLSHFPLYEEWNDFHFNRELINWEGKSKDIDKFFLENDGKEPVKFRIWNIRDKEMKYYKIGFPSGYEKNKQVFLKSLISEESGIEFCLIMMKNTLLQRELGESSKS